MLISPHERERLLIHVAAGSPATAARGPRPDHPGATAIIAAYVEGARDGRGVPT